MRSRCTRRDHQGAAMGTSIGAALLAETSATIAFQPMKKADIETEISHLLPSDTPLLPMPMRGKRR